MKKVIFLFTILLSLSSCENAQQSAKIIELRDSVNVLKDNVDVLTKELEQYKFAPYKIYSQAKISYEENNMNVDSLNKLVTLLKKYHPESMYLLKTEVLVIRANENIENHNKEIQIAKEKAEKERLLAVSKLKKEVDDVSGNTWYYQPYFTHYTNVNRTSIYMGKNGNSVWLRLKMSYQGDSWIFFDNAYLSCNAGTKEIIFDKYEDKKTDNDTSVWEWIDVSVTNDMLLYLRRAVENPPMKMRFSGKYTKTRKLSNSEVKGIKAVLAGYDVLVSENK